MSRARDSGIWIEGPEVVSAPPNPADQPVVSSQHQAQPVVSPSLSVASCGPVADSGQVANSGPVASRGPVAHLGPETIPGPLVTLTSMGFSRLDAEQALRQANNDVSRATSFLIRR